MLGCVLNTSIPVAILADFEGNSLQWELPLWYILTPGVPGPFFHCSSTLLSHPPPPQFTALFAHGSLFVVAREQLLARHA